MKKDAIEELYRLYYNDAFLYTLTVAGDKQTAADAVSGAFYKALLTADDKIKDFKSWLLRVCRNEVYSALRKNRRLVRLSDDERAALKDESENAIERIIREEEYRALHRAMARLGESAREVLTLYYFENMGVKEISEILSKSPEAVKVALFRARSELKKILEAIYEIR